MSAVWQLSANPLLLWAVQQKFSWPINGNAAGFNQSSSLAIQQMSASPLYGNAADVSQLWGNALHVSQAHGHGTAPTTTEVCVNAGWAMIDMAFRKDCIDFIACMNSVAGRLDKGIALAPWQQATLKRWF